MTKRISFVICVCALLSGCGAVVPNMQEFYEGKEDQKDNEVRIIGQIQCELREGVRKAIRELRSDGSRPYNVDWLWGWGAKVNLDITADEKGSINPGASFKHFYGADKFTLGAGGNFSSNATRDEIVEFTYAFSELLAQPERQCTHVDNILIKSDLKIGEFILNKAFLATVPGVARTPYSVFNEKITFVVVFGGSVTPTWEFVDVTAGTSDLFISASRTKTHALTITLAPVLQPKTPASRVRLIPEGEAVHNAAIFGQATANAIRAQQR
jgi:hypothetical protein